ncbi:MAG TPA: cytochrome c family protein [Candidatus Bilophila faecipullorum]|uniref:Cytochrome c family protein n=1 Tax=Candidatus Bilophila faecipullorum TaxID=2838482 RepID=A0A9D1R028_9BACT|nr:cytochrome c3 family protein [uncultured Bilophila sp.]HIW78038.1 cytochrome c family protein [Candidatus Bilophila faecipullorum]
MPRRYVFVTVFCCLMALVAVLGYSQDSTEKRPVRLVLDNPGGRVVFDHQRHAEEYKVACETCHHESATPRDNVQPCGACHGIDFEGSFRDDHVAAFSDDETTCATCHHMSFAAAKWDHEAHATEYASSCTDCHHADADIEPEPGRCSACHLGKPMGGIPDIKAATHQKCASCHEEWFAAGVKGCVNCHSFTDNRKAFAAGEGVDVDPADANCVICHEGAKIKELIPDRMAAFHGQCMTCHEKLGKGPFRKDQCNQCHMK